MCKTMTSKREEIIRKEFIEALMIFSNGQISEQEANQIADDKLNTSDFSNNSPLAHKGPRWLAKQIVAHL